jgi:hypothetical protein
MFTITLSLRGKGLSSLTTQGAVIIFAPGNGAESNKNI